MHINTLYSDLLAKLPASAERRELLQLLQTWLRWHLKEWNAETRKAYGLDELSTLDLSPFPVEQSALNPDEELRQRHNVHPSSKDVLAMFLRDLLWEGITVESDITCPICDRLALKFLEDTKRDEVVLECDQCAWVQTPSGAHIVYGPGDVGTVLPVTAARLQRYRETGR